MNQLKHMLERWRNIHHSFRLVTKARLKCRWANEGRVNPEPAGNNLYNVTSVIYECYITD